MSDTDLGARLKAAREKNKLTQRAVIEKTSIVKEQTLSAYERGINSPPLEILKELSALYRVTTDYLLFGNATPNATTQKSDRDHLIALIEAIDRMDFPVSEVESQESFPKATILISLVAPGGKNDYMDGWTTDEFYEFFDSWAKLRRLYKQSVISGSDYRYLIEKRISSIPDDLDFYAAELPF